MKIKRLDVVLFYKKATRHEARVTSSSESTRVKVAARALFSLNLATFEEEFRIITTTTVNFKP